jgi:hypothetical protein
MEMYVANGEEEDHAEIKSFKVCPGFSCAENGCPGDPENLVSVTTMEAVRETKGKRKVRHKFLSMFLLFPISFYGVLHEQAAVHVVPLSDR